MSLSKHAGTGRINRRAGLITATRCFISSAFKRRMIFCCQCSSGFRMTRPFLTTSPVISAKAATSARHVNGERALKLGDSKRVKQMAINDPDLTPLWETGVKIK